MHFWWLLNLDEWTLDRCTSIPKRLQAVPDRILYHRFLRGLNTLLNIRNPLIFFILLNIIYFFLHLLIKVVLNQSIVRSGISRCSSSMAVGYPAWSPTRCHFGTMFSIVNSFTLQRILHETEIILMNSYDFTVSRNICRLWVHAHLACSDNFTGSDYYGKNRVVRSFCHILFLSLNLKINLS